MNFIIDLSFLKGKNIILTVICKLSKKRHYISCFTDDEKITAEKTAELMLQWIYWIHNLLDFIVLNRNSQFIFILWKSLCKRLNINLQLFTVYHFQINDQSEWVNQNVERYFQFFCLYMQNNWAKLLFIDWSLSWVLSWHFEFNSIWSWIAHIFNSTRVELHIVSTQCNLTRLRIESIWLDSSRTQAWR